MKQAHKKRPHLAAANSPPELPDMGEIYFINLVIYNHPYHSINLSILVCSYWTNSVNSLFNTICCCWI